MKSSEFVTYVITKVFHSVSWSLSLFVLCRLGFFLETASEIRLRKTGTDHGYAKKSIERYFNLKLWEHHDKDFDHTLSIGKSITTTCEDLFKVRVCSVLTTQDSEAVLKVAQHKEVERSVTAAIMITIAYSLSI